MASAWRSTDLTLTATPAHVRQQLAALGERGCAADQGLHPPHARGVLRAVHVQLAVARGEALPAAAAVEIEPSEHHAAEQGDELLGTQPFAMRQVSAGAQAGRARLLRLVLAQQGGQQGGAGPQHGRAGGLLQRFQVEGPGLAPGGGDHVQEAPDFERDFVLDRAGRFFSSGSWRAWPAAAGRWRQMARLTSRSWRESCWNSR